MKYLATKIHRISSSPSDKTPIEVSIPDGAFSDSKQLAAALRQTGLLPKGEQLGSFRVEGCQVHCFPRKGSWHCITLEGPVAY